nr:putative reverse transcriptase domain-containing protein [Tanacetum cinerariifolium]
ESSGGVVRSGEIELWRVAGKKVKRKKDGIFISQDKYVAEILKKFDYLSLKTASTPIETQKPLVKDEEAADVDVSGYSKDFTPSRCEENLLFTMSNTHQKLASPEATVSGKDFSNPFMADDLPKIDVGKLKAKGDIRVFVAYSKESAAFRIYNKRTRKIHESVNVNFDEISDMASKQFSLEPGLSNLNEIGKSSNSSVSQGFEASKKDLEDLFQDFYDEYFDSSKIMKSSTTNVETSINQEVFHEVFESFQEESSLSSLNDDVQQRQEETFNLKELSVRMLMELQGHYKNDCPKLKNKNCGNQTRNGKARGRAYALGGGEPNPDSNIVTGDKSDGRNESRLNIISCTNTQKFLPKGCHDFLARITEKKTEDKSEEKRPEDVPVLRDYLEVFPGDLSGVPPTRQVEFQIVLVPGAAPVARAPYRLAPFEMKELSNQLHELSDKGFIRPSSSPWGAPSMEDEEVHLVDGVFEGALGALALEMEALVDATEFYDG